MLIALFAVVTEARLKSSLTREELFVAIRREAQGDGTITPVKGHIDAMLREDLTAPRRQRHTSERICRRLAAEHGSAAACSRVRDYVAWHRPEIVAGVRDGRRHLDGTVGVSTKSRLFTLRMSYSGKAGHQVSASQRQEAFLAGRLEAFKVLGDVPSRHI